MGDEWDSVVFLESEWFDNGFSKAGENNAALQTTYQEGFINGFIKGFEIGAELMFLWNLTKDRKLKPNVRIDEMKSLVEGFPNQNEKDFDFVQQIERLRTNCSALGTKSVSNYIEKGMGKDRTHDW